MGRPTTDYKIQAYCSCQTMGKWHSTMHLMPLSHGLTIIVCVHVWLHIHILTHSHTHTYNSMTSVRCESLMKASSILTICGCVRLWCMWYSVRARPLNPAPSHERSLAAYSRSVVLSRHLTTRAKVPLSMCACVEACSSHDRHKLVT